MHRPPFWMQETHVEAEAYETLEKKICTRVVQDLKELLGEDAANDIICGFLRSSDTELMEIRRTLERFLHPEAASVR